MADVKISGMTPGTTPLTGAELFEMTQSGDTFSVTAAAIAKAYSTDAANVMPIANGGTFATTQTSGGVNYYDGTRITSGAALTFDGTNLASTGAIRSSSATAGIGYATGAGGAVTQATSRTTGVTLNKVCGAITLFSAAGSATYTTFTVSNSAVAATDNIVMQQKSGTDLYNIRVTAIAAGQFNVSFATTGGTTTEQPVFVFTVLKGVIA